MDGLEVVVVGAGVGGLALAQGLVANGVRVRVYERDPGPRQRDQGYRIHLDATGGRALAEVLPAEVRGRVVETACHPGDLLAGFDSGLTPLFEQTFPVTDPDAVNAVDRFAFRRALMTGLDDVVHFGHEFVDYTEMGDGRVEVRFADGRTTTADVLVGADGVGSRVRARLLPDFEVVDIGIRCVYGKVPLTDAVRARVPDAFLRGFCFASDGSGRGAAFAPVLFREPPAEYGDYLMVVFTGTPEALGHSDDELFALDRDALWQVVVAGTEGWHPSIRELVAAADTASAFPITLRSCTRIDPWRTGRVTLLGDAIHPMTPAAGAGANTALHDAALLTAALCGGGRLVEALARYEQEMIGHAKEVVADSLRRAARLFGTTPPVPAAAADRSTDAP
ncbi:FAD-dependent oxidoreductase [Umezawaea tangerina]|uniref:2-polyprenyl-6-methoxyphenol hydroxylase-like FAD-dependent oxidoreductase n=1 Tax=Umezawaea tangerina TaxID=84725 RepID=A0A2T0SQL5_9PSEU|nr:NAD(P)/FAD-dependent oxidoreductase [Umezawaea tangerina]PRY35707.1 2-polyprenyl-6-methoxyphenol hydroxylase-like FAD-dependent oxidoreductase [Umezawaea tangerina]